MRGRFIVGLGGLLWAAVAPLASAQTPLPQPGPAGSDTAGTPAPPLPPPAPLKAADCTTPFPSTVAPPGNLVMTVAVDARTAWRPRGDAVEFNIQGPGVAAEGIDLVVCYRWKTGPGKAGPGATGWIPAADLRLVAKPSLNGVSYASTVPEALPPAELWSQRLHDKTLGETTTALGLIPLADMRILARQKGTATWTALDVIRPVGISNRALAFFAALAVVLIAWAILLFFAEQRGTPGRNPFLRLVTTDSGYASLSQMQILLWTFVVGASAVYVMVLAGNLVAISTGTLVLLGISGASTVGAKIQSYNDDIKTGATPQPPAEGAPPADGAPAPVAAPAPAAPLHKPRWSDLVVAADNPREIDVTRVQMLFFTVIVALFVSMRVLSSGMIPEIPDGFLVLMGISNGVYLTSKFVPNGAP